jgi:nucleoside phosphorylase
MIYEAECDAAARSSEGENMRAPTSKPPRTSTSTGSASPSQSKISRNPRQSQAHSAEPAVARKQPRASLVAARRSSTSEGTSQLQSAPQSNHQATQSATPLTEGQWQPPPNGSSRQQTVRPATTRPEDRPGGPSADQVRPRVDCSAIQAILSAARSSKSRPICSAERDRQDPIAATSQSQEVRAARLGTNNGRIGRARQGVDERQVGASSERARPQGGDNRRTKEIRRSLRPQRTVTTEVRQTSQMAKVSEGAEAKRRTDTNHEIDIKQAEKTIRGPRKTAVESVGPSAAPPNGGRTSLDNSEYQVGWICALPLEMAAARAMLDETHEPPQEQDPSDHNNYCLGRIQRHNVVIACLTDYGTTSAAAVAQQMLHTFKEIRFGLMVGIGGGVPSPRKDIRLGDIVVSKPEGTFNGVVQYDFGKTVKNGQFERIGSLDRPPQLLLTAQCTLASNHLLGHNDIPKFLSELDIKYPKMPIKFVCPGAENDQLFTEDYEHPDMSSNCDACEASQLIDRQPRESDIPHVHYGLIASGNQVIKHGLTRSKYGKQLGVLCFEMEAAGLMNHFKCLVIRGICDYSDSHKNKRLAAICGSNGGGLC